MYALQKNNLNTVDGGVEVVLFEMDESKRSFIEKFLLAERDMYETQALKGPNPLTKGIAHRKITSPEGAKYVSDAHRLIITPFQSFGGMGGVYKRGALPLR